MKNKGIMKSGISSGVAKTPKKTGMFVTPAKVSVAKKG